MRDAFNRRLPLQKEANVANDDDDFLAELDRKITAMIRGGGGSDPWALYLIRALWPYPSGTERQDTLQRIKERCAADGRKLQPSYEQTVQRTFNSHNSDRSGAPPKTPLFHCGGQPGSGLWALHHDNAKAWMTAQKLSLD